MWGVYVENSMEETSTNIKDPRARANARTMRLNALLTERTMTQFRDPADLFKKS